jgi:hypothetical protein
MMVRPLFFLLPRFDLEDGPEVVVNSKNLTPFSEKLERRCFLATSIVEREHAWNRQWIF